ncbi:hypothetical protein [Latilactobacillus curvatus]
MKTNNLVEKYSKIQAEIIQNSEFENINTREAAVTKIKFCIIPDMPLINKLLPVNYYEVSAVQNDVTAYNSFQSIRSALLTQFYEYKQEVKNSINPIYAIQDMLLIPSNILAWLGIRLSISSGRILSVLIWIFGFVATNYGKDILSFFIKHFVNH